MDPEDAASTRPKPTSDAIRRRMQRARRRDTDREVSLRSELHRRGRRFRVDHPLPFDRRRRADIAFTRLKVAIFVDGCFWHACPTHGTLPKANRAWWSAKLAANRARDQDSVDRLEAAGWVALRFWEHQDAQVAADEIETTLDRIEH